MAGEVACYGESAFCKVTTRHTGPCRIGAADGIEGWMTEIAQINLYWALSLAPRSSEPFAPTCPRGARAPSGGADALGHVHDERPRASWLARAGRVRARRAVGGHVPPRRGAGLLDVHDPAKVIAIELADEHFKRLVIEVDDPEATITAIETAISGRGR